MKQKGRVYATSRDIEKAFEKCNGLGLKGDWIDGVIEPGMQPEIDMDASTDLSTHLGQALQARQANALLVAKNTKLETDLKRREEELTQLKYQTKHLEGQVSALEKMLERFSR